MAISAAVDASLRVLRVAQKLGVKRVVLTGAIASMMASMKTGTFGPSDWTNIEAPDVNTQAKSKTLTEKATSDFINGQEGDAPMELTVMTPGVVFGPPLGSNISGQSLSLMDQILRGKVPMVPNGAFPMVDVRDVSKLHVQALAIPQAVGKRIIVSRTEPVGLTSVAQFLKDAGYKGPSTRIAPNFLLRLMAKFDREAKGLLTFLDMNLSADISETRDLFGWKPIHIKQSILDTAIAIKAIKGKT